VLKRETEGAALSLVDGTRPRMVVVASVIIAQMEGKGTMKAKRVTRIVLWMTEEEAQRAVINVTDAQIAIHAALRENEPLTITELIEQNAPRLLAAPGGDGKGRKKHKVTRVKSPKLPRSSKRKPMKKPAPKECPFCHEMKSPFGFKKHLASCDRLHNMQPKALVENGI